MTTVYFVRHAQAQNNDLDTKNRRLTEKGTSDCRLVTEYLSDKHIDIVFSSHYRRTLDTLMEFVKKNNLEIHQVEDFCERISIGTRVSDYELRSYYKELWDDFSYAANGEECFGDVQKRNIKALETVLKNNRGKNIVIGTHGIALSTIINHYDNTFSFSDYWDMLFRLPWIVKADFDDNGCVGMQKIDFFSSSADTNSHRHIVDVQNFDSLKAYRFVVIFSRYKDRWIYSRAKTRTTFETAGGHIEDGETPLQAAKRELYEETGAIDFEIYNAFDYIVHTESEYSNGQVFYAKINKLGKLPSFEMTEVKLYDTVPDEMRFPYILPVLFDELQNHLPEGFYKIL